MSKRNRRDGLHSLVVGFPYHSVKSDKRGRYVPYCDSQGHQGLILDESVCRSRQCQNYHKLYITNQNREYGK